MPDVNSRDLTDYSHSLSGSIKFSGGRESLKKVLISVGCMIRKGETMKHILLIILLFPSLSYSIEDTDKSKADLDNAHVAYDKALEDYDQASVAFYQVDEDQTDDYKRAFAVYLKAHANMRKARPCGFEQTQCG